MAERITVTYAEGFVGVVHTRRGRRIGYTVAGITTQINGGGGGEVESPRPVTEIAREFDALGREIPTPVALVDKRKWNELQASRTPAEIQAIRDMPLRPK